VKQGLPDLICRSWCRAVLAAEADVAFRRPRKLYRNNAFVLKFVTKGIVREKILLVANTSTCRSKHDAYSPPLESFGGVLGVIMPVSKSMPDLATSLRASLTTAPPCKQQNGEVKWTPTSFFQRIRENGQQSKAKKFLTWRSLRWAQVRNFNSNHTSSNKSARSSGQVLIKVSRLHIVSYQTAQCDLVHKRFAIFGCLFLVFSSRLPVYSKRMGVKSCSKLTRHKAKGSDKFGWCNVCSCLCWLTIKLAANTLTWSLILHASR